MNERELSTRERISWLANEPHKRIEFLEATSHDVYGQPETKP